MNGNLGALTAYDVEYIYHFLGVEKVDKKLKELEGKATMGVTFQEFLNRDPQFSYFSGTGKFWIYTLMLDWFKDDLELHIFLYNKSKNYTETNYNEGVFLIEKWEEHKRFLDKMISRNPEKAKVWEHKKISPYWIEFHFFIQTIANLLMKYRSDPSIASLLVEVFSYYFNISDKITARFKINDWPEQGLANILFMKMEQFYNDRMEMDKVVEIREKAKRQGWRPFVFT